MHSPSSPSLHPDIVEDALPPARPPHGAHGTKPMGEMPAVRVAIVDSNMLACMGLSHILRSVIPIAVVEVYHTFAALQEAAPEEVAHYFVASRIYIEHTQFFRQRAYKTIVLVSGENLPPLPGILTLNINRSEQELTTDLLQLHQHGHGSGPHRPRPPKSMPALPADEQPLTPRETEVVQLLARGLANKEIADAMNIGLTTVITHRKNIMNKLAAHSLSDIIIYAVMNGLVEVGE